MKKATPRHISSELENFLDGKITKVAERKERVTQLDSNQTDISITVEATGQRHFQRPGGK